MKPGGNAASAPLCGKDSEPTIFEFSKKGRKAYSLPDCDIPQCNPKEVLPEKYLAQELPPLPELSERDLVGHFTRLAHRQYSVDLGMYPLGSCTMKYNPKFCDEIASYENLLKIHPCWPVELCQGWLEIFIKTEELLCEITGTSAVSFQPAAGAAGELTGLLIIKKYLELRGENRSAIIIPDSAHGTNPASVTLAGFKALTVGTNQNGTVDLKKLKDLISSDVAGIMLTNPNTLGLFEKDIQIIAELIHEAGGLLYYDGANLNAILGKCRPGDMGFDIVHLNLHKTFATPHGGGGPGAGPVCVVSELKEFLPEPYPIKTKDNKFILITPKHSIGKIHSFMGNALVVARALAYILYNGSDGLKKVAEAAVLNANWLKKRLSAILEPSYNDVVMHEVVMSATEIKKKTGVKAFDIAKRLLDKGFHSPTMYFPLLVDEALMIEPTETESPETLEAFALALEQIINECLDEPELVKNAPFNTPVRRVNEAKAAKDLIVSF